MKNWLALVAAALLPISATAADLSREQILRGIGEAVAADEKIKFAGAAIVATATVSPADEAAWEKKAIDALSILYAPPGSVAKKIEYSALRESSKVEMARQRTPEQVVRDVIAPSRTIVTVRWSIGGGEFESFAVFDGNTLVFDTVLSMPIIRAPIFSVPHL